MADFTSSFWPWFIGIFTVLGIAYCFILIRWMSRGIKVSDGETGDTGHVWDEDLRELNNPLPKWWLNLFYITLFFSIIYLILYPGLGSFQGVLGWSQESAYEAEMNEAEDRFGPLFRKFLEQDIVAVSKDPHARKIGERLFLNYCSTCHGSDARGARGFPNLRDNDWLWGGSAEAIKTTISSGRTGVMPAWEAPLGGHEGVQQVTDFVLSLSGREHSAEGAEAGKPKYQMFCAGCHGLEGQGNPMLGAPILSDDTWLHGASRKKIAESIATGRNNHMPPHQEFLGEAKVHLLSAYIYGLSGEK